ncbi:MAG: hypothetical protein NTX53_05885 [candidate division WOR-3 bacterium]|nr:hypothetical protein [candidate division WOR-3 bacterium]
MRPLSLITETEVVFSRIRTYDWVLLAYGMSHAKVWRLVEARVKNRINAAGVATQEWNMYRSFVWELLKAFRTQTGEPLVNALELAIRKWANYGLRPELLQELLGDCFLRLEQSGYGEPRSKTRPIGKRRGPKPQGSYEKALKKGRASRARSGKVEEQAAKQKAGSAQASEIADKLRPILAAREIPGAQFVAYFAFAQRLGRLSRNYTAKSLAMAASDLIDFYEAKSLDDDALRAIAATLFGVTNLDRAARPRGLDRGAESGQRPQSFPSLDARGMMSPKSQPGNDRFKED